jgi:hypothetical protein
VSHPFTFDEFADGLAWYLVGPEGRPRDFNATLYADLQTAWQAGPLTGTYWAAVLQGLAQWNPANPALSLADAVSFVQRALEETQPVARAIQKAATEVVDRNLDFPAMNPNAVIDLHEAVSQLLGPANRHHTPLLCHLILPFAFPAHDATVIRFNDLGELLNNYVLLQGDLKVSDQRVLEQIAQIVTVIAAAVSPSAAVAATFPKYLVTAELVELGRAHPGYFVAHADESVNIQGFGKTLRDALAMIAALMNHESQEPVLSEAMYQKYTLGSSFRFDLRLDYRGTPLEEDSERRHSLFTSVHLVEGLLWWLYRVRAPRDFLLQTYQQSVRHRNEGRVLSESHIDVVIRGLNMLSPLLSNELDLERLRAELYENASHLYGEYLRSVAPYQNSSIVWMDLPSKTDGLRFFDFVRELPSLTNDGDASWVCHLLSPGSFAPLATGGEHHLGVSGYGAYNARVKDLYRWYQPEASDPFARTFFALQYLASGTSFENLRNIDASMEWPMIALATFLALEGANHPGLARQLVDEGITPLEGLLQPTDDLRSSVLLLESHCHGPDGWFLKGMAKMLDSVQSDESSVRIGRFLVPTQLFEPSPVKLHLGAACSPEVLLRFPIQLQVAEATLHNFSRASA